MMLSVTKAISDITKVYFEKLLLAGAFPEVQFEQGERFTSFSLLDYSNINARYMKLLDKYIKEVMLDSLGVFTRKRSKEFLKSLESILATITEQDIRNHPDRFRSFGDAVLEEAMK